MQFILYMTNMSFERREATPSEGELSVLRNFTKMETLESWYGSFAQIMKEENEDSEIKECIQLRKLI